MNTTEAAKIFKELGHPIRLEIIKELIKYNQKGLPVGELKKILDIPNSTLSHHISALISTNLISQQRQGTILLCKFDMNRMNEIIQFLFEQCCEKDMM